MPRKGMGSRAMDVKGERAAFLEFGQVLKKQGVDFPMQLRDVLKRHISSQDGEDHDHIIRSLIACS
jgi:hypothetical protein